MKKILISFQKDDSLDKTIKGLEAKGHSVISFRKKPDLDLENPVILLLSVLLFPIIFLSNLLRLAYLKQKYKIDSLICLDWYEKIILSPAADLLKIKTVWIELPGADFKKIKKSLLFFYKINNKRRKIVVFNKLTEQQLNKSGVKSDIQLIAPAIKSDQRRHQENIYSGLAKNGTQFNKKFFVVGTFSSLNKGQNIETLFQAIKICTEVIPNIQLIIVGEGEERKNLNWLAKKMGIDGLVWIVSEQGQARKWLDNFDIFVVSKKIFRLSDLEMILKGMAAGIPIIAPSDSGLEEIIEDSRNGYLVDPGSSELFARQIMKLGQDERLRLKLGQIAKEKVEELFTLEKQIKSIEEII